jgi:tRNA pseudouridine55 synthase
MDGILVLAKPAGPTSHDMVALVRRLAATRRVGHGGTLDPFATGVLPIFLGRATRVVEYHVGDPKNYRATICFGASSTTDDLEGELTPATGPPPRQAALEGALAGFLGRIVQRPPAFSAIRVSGRRAYALARAGETPELTPREVTIHRIDLVSWDASEPERPVAVVDVDCSAGTYIRALARDLGEAVGSVAYLGALVRTASGRFRIEDAASLDDLRAAAAAGPTALRALLRPIDWGLESFPAVTLTPDELAAVSRGQVIRPSAGMPDGSERVRLLDRDGNLVAIAARQGARLAPDKVLVEVRSPEEELEAAELAEQDPPRDSDPDPASPDD